MTMSSDQPGWRPDPERAGMVRWWNGLGWSDARRSADAAVARVRGAAEEAARGSTISHEQVGRTTADPRMLKPARAATAIATPAASTTATNGLSRAAVPLAVIGLGLGVYGLVPLVGLVLSLAGLVRSRRLARDGARRTGFGQALVGLAFSIAGLLRWAPTAVESLAHLQRSLGG